MKLTIGTRKSALALWQAEHIKKLIEEKYPHLEVVLKKIMTSGDKILDVPLAKIGGKGLFTKELEVAMLNGEIDLAVHSLKDMPTVLPTGLKLAAITKRAEPFDAFVSNKFDSLAEMPVGAVLGTSSLRRKAQILAVRPDLKIVDLRGNINTRVQKLDNGEMDAIVLAVAGLIRLGWQERIKEILDKSICLPAVGQGALAIETRADDKTVNELIAFLNDDDTNFATTAERSYLALLEGGCQVPIGVFATVAENTLVLEAIISSLDGKNSLRDQIIGSKTDCEQLGQQLGLRMLQNGGKDILAEVIN